MRGHDAGPSQSSAVDVYVLRPPSDPSGVSAAYRVVLQHGNEGTEPVPNDARDAERDQESPLTHFRSSRSGQHREWRAAGKQRSGSTPNTLRVARAGKPKQRNKLLEVSGGERMDTTAPGPATAAIDRWKPWQRSTGPRTLDGKARVSRNAYRGGHRTAVRKLIGLLREQRRELGRVSERITATAPRK
jgi:hypothetical protein